MPGLSSRANRGTRRPVNDANLQADRVTDACQDHRAIARMSFHPRRAQRTDDNQVDIVKALRDIPGVSVDVGHDDILVGYEGNTYWFEIKHPSAVSPRTEKVRPSEKTQTERNRETYWEGHYSIVWSFEQILDEIGIER